MPGGRFARFAKLVAGNCSVAITRRKRRKRKVLSRFPETIPLQNTPIGAKKSNCNSNFFNDAFHRRRAVCGFPSTVQLPMKRDDTGASVPQQQPHFSYPKATRTFSDIGN